MLQSKNMLGEVLVEVVGQRLALGIELDDVDVDVDLDDDDDDYRLVWFPETRGILHNHTWLDLLYVILSIYLY